MNKIGRNDPCWCGSGKKLKKCHGEEEAGAKPKKNSRQMQIMTPESLPKMRKSCRLAANILEELCAAVKPGITTQDLDDLSMELTLKAGAYPAPLNYPKGITDPRNPKITAGGFPKSICTSVNDVVCHGVPSSKQLLKDGDILNIDVTCILDGYFGDTSRTVFVGTPSEEARKLTETAYECMHAGIMTIRPGSRLMEIGQAIFDIADRRGYGVVREYTGHGIGTIFHAEPQVCHYPNRSTDCTLVQGMTFTVEPMINIGTWQTVLDNKDHWTVYTLDGKLSAQFEHTVVVTETGHEILTLPG